MVLVPFGPLRWYRLVRYDGTDCSATVVPIRPLRWYRLTDTITLRGWVSSVTHFTMSPSRSKQFLQFTVSRISNTDTGSKI